MESTKVISIRQAPSGWRDNQEYVYIGRAGRGMFSIFGNPVRSGLTCPSCKEIHSDPDGGKWQECYRAYLENRLEKDEKFRNAVIRLRGKTLVCFCKPNPCHGDILAEFADKMNTSDEI